MITKYNIFGLVDIIAQTPIDIVNYIHELAMVSKPRVRERSPMEESRRVTVSVAPVAVAITRVSMAVAGVSMVAIARMVSTMSNAVVAVAPMAIASMVSAKSSCTYRSITCTEEGTKGTWVKICVIVCNIICLPTNHQKDEPPQRGGAEQTSGLPLFEATEASPVEALPRPETTLVRGRPGDAKSEGG